VHHLHKKLAPKEITAFLQAPNQFCYYVGVFNVILYIMFLQKKELLDIRTSITHLGLDKDVFHNKQETQDILQAPDRADIPVFLQSSL
jgi:hypothetical protein